MSRRLTRVASALIAAIGLVLMAAPTAVLGSAPATAVVDDGWWNRAQSGVGLAIPSPPGVSDEQLVVQFAVGGESARAAISVELADGQASPVLTLRLADVQGSPLVLACQAGSAWTGVHNGNWDARPTAECTTSVVGELSEDETTMTFDLSPLQFNDKLNVVFVPAVEEGSPAVPFRIVVEAPTADDLSTTGGDAPPPTAVPTTAPATPPDTAPPTTAAPEPTLASGGGFQSPITTAPLSPPTTSAPASTSVLTPAIDPAEEGLTATAPIVNETTAPALDVDEVSSSRTGARVVGMLVLLVAVAAGVLAWRDSAAAPVATAAVPVVGGLARFRGERTSEPTSIS